MTKKIRQKRTSILAALAFLTSAPVFAQENEIKPFAPESEFRTWSVGIGAGLINQWNVMGFRRHFQSIEHQLGYSFYVKKQITSVFGLKAAYVGGKLKGGSESNDYKFSSKFPWSAALSAELTLANISWRQEEGTIKPYIGAGLGVFNYNTTLTKYGIENESGSISKTFIPATAGLKFGVTKNMNIDVAYQVSLVNSNTLDGVNRAKKDMFSYVHAGVEFILGDIAKPFLGNRNPVVDMRKEYLNLASYDELAAALKAQQKENKALETQLIQLTNNLADDDGDGVANKFDKCPDSPSNMPVDGSGCPLSEVKIQANMDTNNIINEIIENLEFDLNKTSLRPSSYPRLDRIAKLLIQKHLRLKLTGHTDSSGTEQLNMSLSTERAEAAKAYLVNKGVNPASIEVIGYGAAKPIASNESAEGRQANRRVEFTLY